MVQPGTTIGHREDPNLVQILKEDQTGVLGPQAEVEKRICITPKVLRI